MEFGRWVETQCIELTKMTWTHCCFKILIHYDSKYTIRICCKLSRYLKFNGQPEDAPPYINKWNNFQGTSNSTINLKMHLRMFLAEWSLVIRVLIRLSPKLCMVGRAPGLERSRQLTLRMIRLGMELVKLVLTVNLFDKVFSLLQPSLVCYNLVDRLVYYNFGGGCGYHLWKVQDLWTVYCCTEKYCILRPQISVNVGGKQSNLGISHTGITKSRPTPAGKNWDGTTQYTQLTSPLISKQAKLDGYFVMRG
jgi:hypothetical protein